MRSLEPSFERRVNKLEDFIAAYKRRVAELEDEGLTTSDAQSIADMELESKEDRSRPRTVGKNLI